MSVYSGHFGKTAIRPMPIEIKELHIRVSVNTTRKRAAGGRTNGSPAVASSMAGEEAKDALVAECVEQVLQILHNKMER